PQRRPRPLAGLLPRLRQLLRQLSARLGEVGTPPAATPGNGGGLTHPVSGLQPAGDYVVARRRHEHHLLCTGGGEHGSEGAGPGLDGVGGLPQLLVRGVGNLSDDDSDAPDLGCRIEQARCRSAGVGPAPATGELLLEHADLLAQRFDAGRRLFGRRREGLADAAKIRLDALNVIQSLLTGDGGDAAHALAGRLLSDDLEEADVAGAIDVGAAAELDGAERAGPLR